MAKTDGMTFNINVASGYFIKQVEAFNKAVNDFKGSIVDLHNNNCHSCGTKLNDVTDADGFRYCESCNEWINQRMLGDNDEQ
jgi:hypothetical protein